MERLRAARDAAGPEELARLRAQVAQLASQNDRLASTLRDARDQIVALKAEVDRLAQPPNTYGIYVGPGDEDGTVDVMSSGRKMRVAVSPSVERDDILAGQEVMLNEAFNVVAARSSSAPARSSSSRSSSTRTARWSWPTPTRSGSSTSRARCAASSCASGTP